MGDMLWLQGWSVLHARVAVSGLISCAVMWKMSLPHQQGGLSITYSLFLTQTQSVEQCLSNVMSDAGKRCLFRLKTLMFLF